MERFSPVRRFSDGAAPIQAFKAHLEHSSLIKKLKQVCHYFLLTYSKKIVIAGFAVIVLALPLNTYSNNGFGLYIMRG